LELNFNIEKLNSVNKYVLWSSALLLPGGFMLLAYYLFDKNLKAVREAKKYIGEEEKTGNMGFYNSEFDALMREYGFVTGDQWCAHFASMIWKKKHKNRVFYDAMVNNLSPSTQRMYNNFSKDTSGYFKVSDRATKGAIVIWQSTNNSATGHAGIVQKHNKDGFETIEGNVNNADGYSGEGIVAEKQYTYDKEFNVKNGNKLRGFIQIL